MSSKLSISIVSYHNYGDILKLLKTIEEYTDKGINKKVYVIDNGSSSIEVSAVNKFKDDISKYDYVSYVDPKSNIGFGKGHNFILEDLDSEYHAIVNPDILLKEDSFSKIIHYLERS